ncbi:amidase domain-containing protein [Lentzea tibetensis]|nr:amidase domain-containing protein [Lentzea tibetensis]
MAPHSMAEPVLTDEQKKEVAGLAQQYLQERAERLVVGTVRAQQSMTSVRTSSALSERFAAEARGLDERREKSRQANGGKKAAAVDLQDVKWSGDSTNVQLDATESTKLFFVQHGPGAPDHEQFWLEHTFIFVRGQGGWTMSRATPHLQAGPAPSTQVASGRPPVASEPKTDQLPLWSDTDRSHPTTAAVSRKVLSGEVGAAGPPYDYYRMVNYARVWAYGRNPEYRDYPDNDCTNFISQVMRSGGWDFNGSGIFERDDPDKWFYGGGPGETFLTSYSWAGAHNWGVFAQIYSKRTSGLENVWLMDLADVLQVDWFHDDGANIIDHSMVVTWRDDSGGPYAQELYLTYHTANNRDKKLTDLLAENSNPAHTWYAHRT